MFRTLRLLLKTAAVAAILLSALLAVHVGQHRLRHATHAERQTAATVLAADAAAGAAR